PPPSATTAAPPATQVKTREPGSVAGVGAGGLETDSIGADAEGGLPEGGVVATATVTSCVAEGPGGGEAGAEGDVGVATVAGADPGGGSGGVDPGASPCGARCSALVLAA